MPNRRPDQLTLHEAMLDVLRRSKLPLTAKEISAEIERRDLFVRRDGEYPPPSQIQARARKYPHLFTAAGSPLQYRPS